MQEIAGKELNLLADAVVLAESLPPACTILVLVLSYRYHDPMHSGFVITMSYTAPSCSLAALRAEVVARAKPQRGKLARKGFGSSATAPKRKEAHNSDYMITELACPCGSGREFQVSYSKKFCTYPESSL